VVLSVRHAFRAPADLRACEVEVQTHTTFFFWYDAFSQIRKHGLFLLDNSRPLGLFLNPDILSTRHLEYIPSANNGFFSFLECRLQPGAINPE